MKIILPALITIGIFLVLTPLFATLTSNLHPIVLMVLFFCIFVMTLSIYLFLTKTRLPVSKKSFHSILGLYAVSLLILLFFRPNGQSYDSVNLLPFQTISFYLAGEVHWLISLYNLAANIGLFIPFGIYLRTKSASSITLVTVPIAAISVVEVTQFLTKRGSLDIDDLLLNVLGFFIGYALYPLFLRIIEIRELS